MTRKKRMEERAKRLRIHARVQKGMRKALQGTTIYLDYLEGIKPTFGKSKKQLKKWLLRIAERENHDPNS